MPYSKSVYGLLQFRQILTKNTNEQALGTGANYLLASIPTAVPIQITGEKIQSPLSKPRLNLEGKFYETRCCNRS